MPRDFQISRDNQALFITLNTTHRLAVFKKGPLNLVLTSAIDEARRSAKLLLFACVL